MSDLNLNCLNDKRIFITGGTGFFGKNILKYLIDNDIKPQRVTVLSRNSKKFIANHSDLISEYLDFVESDILDLKWNNNYYDYLIHAATSVVEQNSSEVLYSEIVNGTQNTISFAKKSGVKVFINISSGGVYQSNNICSGLSEDSPLLSELMNSKNTYGLAKISAEHLVYLATETANFKAISLRCFCFAGDYLDSEHFAIGEFVKKALNNEDIIVNASAGIYRSYLSSFDLVNQILNVIQYVESMEKFYDVFNLGSNEAISLPELAHKVVCKLNSKSRVIIPNLDNHNISYYVPKIDKIKKIIALPSSDLNEIISLTARYYDHATIKLAEPSICETPIKELANLDVKRNSVSAIIACYNDSQAIPIMAERLVNVFTKCKLDYEIIFVSNGSNDNSIDIIKQLSEENNHIIGVTHSRSFEQTSQASFLNGMALSTKQACVLLDGDLQDPPEMIEGFVEKWREGFDVVYGIRHKREAPLFVQIGSKIFYRIFDKLSSVQMPHDAGDFSLIDRRAVDWMLATQEHDVLIRGMRAYVGFKHTGIKYFRPERMFGKSSNNFFKLILWLKKGIFSYSRKPLDWMTTAGFCMVSLTIILAIVQIFIRILEPSATPHGLTTVILLIMFFGSSTILSISILGEYIGKIVEETKNRPIYIRDLIIEDGQIKKVSLNRKFKDVQ